MNKTPEVFYKHQYLGISALKVTFAVQPIGMTDFDFEDIMAKTLKNVPI